MCAVILVTLSKKKRTNCWQQAVGSRADAVDPKPLDDLYHDVRSA